MSVTISNIKTEKLAQKKLAYIQNIGPYKGDTELFGRLFTTVMNWGIPKGLFTSPDFEAITVYHDDPENVPEDQQRISVGFTVSEDVEAEDDIQTMEIPKGLYVVGSFEILPHEYGDAWSQVFDYINTEGFQPTGIMYESYKNEPNTHPEGKHLVDICVAIIER